MRTWTLVLFVAACVPLAACGGTDTNGGYSYSSTVDDGGGGGGGGGGGTVEDLGCENIPEFNTGNLDCEELWVALDDTVNAALTCFKKADCRALAVQCENWDQASCYVIANTCLGERDLDQFHPEQNGLTCDVVVPGFPDTDCECGGPPVVDCVDGVCDEAFTPP